MSELLGVLRYLLFVPNLTTVVQYGTQKVSAAQRKGIRQHIVIRPALNGPDKSCNVRYRKISQHIKCDWYATQPGLEDFRTKHVDSRLCMLYKIRNNLALIEEDKYLQRGTVRRSHQCRQIRADRDYTLFSFFPRTTIPKSDMLGRSSRNLQDQDRDDRALQTQLIPKISYHAFLSFLPSIFLIPTDLSHLFHFSIFSLLALNWW